MATTRRNDNRPHEQAVAILEQHVSHHIGKTFEADASCNECGEPISINLVERANSVKRNRQVGPVRPDLSIFDSEEEPIRFIEIVDSHKPQSNVHEYALAHNIEVVEIHLNTGRGFAGERVNRALDTSLVAKARLEDLKKKNVNIDAHNLLCERPKCEKCASPLPQRIVAIHVKDCWKCGQHVNVAVGSKDRARLEADDFTDEELTFAKANGVILERRFSLTMRSKYVANVCTYCDQIQGKWFLDNPFLVCCGADGRFRLHKTERKGFGPCDTCAKRLCLHHDEYFDYTGDGQCPECVLEAERVMCPNIPDRDCFYPDRCRETGCYFVNREQRRGRVKLSDTRVIPIADTHIERLCMIHDEYFVSTGNGQCPKCV